MTENQPGCDSTFLGDDGVIYECAGISCPISEWLGIEDRGHKAWAVDVEWTDSEAREVQR